jgi:hypothetical protein
MVLGKMMALEKKVINRLRIIMVDHRSGLRERIEQLPEHPRIEISNDLKLSDLTANLPLLEVQRSMRDQAVHQLNQIEMA